MNHLGELIASSTTRLTAQAPDESSAPPLGGFVVVEAPGGTAVAVVCEVRAASFDAHRRPIAFGIDEDELYRRQPQLRELLVTEFDACLVGYRDDGVWRQILPPRPPRLHRFVYPAEPEPVREITADGGYLRTLTAAELSDDVLAAAVRWSLPAHSDRPGHLIATGQALARLLGDDYDRLQALLRRIAP